MRILSARTRRCTCPHQQWPPPIGCRDGHLIEEHPLLVEPEFFAPWDMTPRGPFRIQRYNEQIGALSIQQWVTPTLERAADRFLTSCQPALDGWVAYAMDESYRVILGVSAMASIMESFGHPARYGVQAAFDALESAGAPAMDVAVWSELAKRCAR